MMRSKFLTWKSFREIYCKGDKTTEDSKRVEAFWRAKLEAEQSAGTE
jgi:hypothetical protein